MKRHLALATLLSILLAGLPALAGDGDFLAPYRGLLEPLALRWQQLEQVLDTRALRLRRALFQARLDQQVGTAFLPVLNPYAGAQGILPGVVAWGPAGPYAVLPRGEAFLGGKLTLVHERPWDYVLAWRGPQGVEVLLVDWLPEPGNPVQEVLGPHGEVRQRPTHLKVEHRSTHNELAPGEWMPARLFARQELRIAWDLCARQGGFVDRDLEIRGQTSVLIPGEGSGFWIRTFKARLDKERKESWFKWTDDPGKGGVKVRGEYRTPVVVLGRECLARSYFPFSQGAHIRVRLEGEGMEPLEANSTLRLGEGKEERVSIQGELRSGERVVARFEGLLPEEAPDLCGPDILFRPAGAGEIPGPALKASPKAPCPLNWAVPLR